MRRHVRAFGHVTHVTEIAVVDHFPIGLLIDAVDFAGLRLVDQIEQRRDGVAQVEAAAAAVADFEYPLEFLIERGRVVELRILPAEGVARRRLQTAFAVLLYLSVRHDISRAKWRAPPSEPACLASPGAGEVEDGARV